MRITIGVAIGIALIIFWYLKDHLGVLNRSPEPVTHGVSLSVPHLRLPV